MSVRIPIHISVVPGETFKHFFIFSVIQKPQKTKSRNFEFIAPNKSTNNSRSNNSSDTQSNQIAEIYGPENGMVYLLKNPRDPLLHIHLFESDSVEEVSDFIIFLFLFLLLFVVLLNESTL